MAIREQNSLLRLFGSPSEVLAKAGSDLARLTDALSSGKQQAALWALTDCSITVFHVGDWIRATHTDHQKAAVELQTRSKWIRMTRDICHAAKHGDLTWKSQDADVHGAVLVTMKYGTAKTAAEPRDEIVVIATDGETYDALEVLRHAMADWSRFIAARGI